MVRKKSPRPEKLCVVYGRPFQWRKKREKVWDEVKYRNERCRRERNKRPKTE
ncbi:MAG: DUF2256 domain-containing protein [Planctomycetaceae bacterium]|nr:DUF2256 domain-containing protein [Planctomycetaceae bacterium]